ncbi:MAG: cupin domain-containing protein [Thermoguttaceae bacterium]
MKPKIISTIRRKFAHFLAILALALALAAAARVGAGDKPAAHKPLAEYVHHVDKIHAETSAWGSLRWLINAKLDANSPLTLGIAEINPGQSNPLHLHGNSDEVIYVLSGSCEQRVGDETIILKAGDTLRIPAGVPHQAKALGNEPLKSLVVYNTGNRQFTPVIEKAK